MRTLFSTVAGGGVLQPGVSAVFALQRAGRMRSVNDCASLFRKI
ncbi:MAG TPA: hypothetical protein VMH80_24645 [Bryobacteraceae bacterium]|nr:hypothetical protein [Bryobacteraceae bacterium]